jgi:Glycosyltransferase family 87
MSIRVSVGRLLEPVKVSLFLWGCWLAPLFVVVALVRYTAAHPAVFGYDFKATIYEPGRAVLLGHSPYPDAAVGSLVGRPTFVYPPLLLWIDVPIALLPLHVAQAVWTILLEGGIAAAMYLLGVRDWRCFGLALLTVPTLDGLAVGNVTLLLVPALALVWTSRDRRLALGIAVGLLVGVKLLMWPLFVWLLVTRRARSALIAAATGAISVLGSWALIGMRGFAEYPHLLHIVSTQTAGPRAYSIAVLSETFGLSLATGHLIQWAAGAALLAVAGVIARGTNGDRRSFSAVVIAALVISPVVWLHYFAFLLVPIALLRPRLSAVWAVPAAFWVASAWGHGHATFLTGRDDAGSLVGVVPSASRIVLALGLAAVTLAWTGVSRGDDPLGGPLPKGLGAP